MAISSSLTADEIVALAWEMLGVVPMGRSPSAIQRKRGRQALNALLKRMPQYGYAFPATTDVAYPLNLKPGPAGTDLPADFYGAPSLMLLELGLRDGFDREDGAIGTAESGQVWSLPTGTTFEIENGEVKATAVAGGPFAYTTGLGKDGIVGMSLPTLTVAEGPGIAFRLRDPLNALLFFATVTGWAIATWVAGVMTIKKTYTSVIPANGDVIEVKYLGSVITPSVNGAELEPYVTTLFLEDEGMGFGSNGATSRLKNVFWSNGIERDPVEIVLPAYWHQLTSKMSTADYPTHAVVSADKKLRLWPAPSYFCRGNLLYQKKITDTVDATAPDVDEAFHWDLAKGVAVELAGMVGRSEKKRELQPEWAEARTLGILAQDGFGEVNLDYEE